MNNTEQIVNRLIGAELKEFKVACPAKVVGVSRLKEGFIDVKPIVNFQNKYTLEYYEHPIIRDVRVIFPSTKRSTFCFPLEHDDHVQLIFQSSNIQKFVDGNVEFHNPLMRNSNNLHDVVAYAGFTPYQESCFNPNNYNKDFNENNLNIVHNKGQENEVSIALTDNGDITVLSGDVNIEAETMNTNQTLITVDNDIIINGVSLWNFIQTYTHDYTDDGRAMITKTPNI